MTLPGMEMAVTGSAIPVLRQGQAEAGPLMGADLTRARAARHAVMARLVPDCRCCGKVGTGVEKTRTVQQSGATKTGLGCALAIFSVPGPPWPRLALGGVFFERGQGEIRHPAGATRCC